MLGKAGVGGETSPTDLPLYRAELILDETGVRSREVVTSCYTSYVVTNLSIAHASNPTDFTFILMISMGLSGYLNTSFWDDSKPFGLYDAELWNVRRSLGKPFTDRLAGAMVQILSDNPSEIRTRAVALDFATLLEIGDSVIDSGCSNWPTIRQAVSNLQYRAGAPVIDDLKKQDLSKMHVSGACLDMWKRTN
jgi:hypothetical protein